MTQEQENRIIEEFDEMIGEKHYKICEGKNCVCYEEIKFFILSKIKEAEDNAQEEYKQFILNVLEGIDIADEMEGNSGGGTKAIRLAIKSRIK